jgi:prepilin-type N-terminal cleavage/methylation domain-containing protein
LLHLERKRASEELGFTLVELLIVVALLPILIGGISVALISVLSQAKAVSTQTSHYGDTQLVSQNFIQDVQSATQITATASPTNPSVATTCNSSSASSSFVTSLEWTAQLKGVATQVVTSYYVVAQPGPGSLHGLERQLCLNGSANHTASSIIAYDVQPHVAVQISGNTCDPTTMQCQNAQNAANAKWVTTAGINGVVLPVQAQSKSDAGYQYTLNGVPRLTNNISRGQLPPGHPPLLILGNNPLNCKGNGTVSVTGITAINSTKTPTVSASGGTSSVTLSGGLYTDTTTTSGVTSGNVTLGPGTSVTDNTFTNDPYAGLIPPSTSDPSVKVFTSKVQITGPQQFADGIYIFEQGLSETGLGQIVGTTPNVPPNVLFYVTGGSVDLEGNGAQTLNPLSSPPSPAPGVVIWQAASDNSDMKLAGNGQSSTINGTVYAPSALVSTVGNGQLTTNSLVSNGIGRTGTGCTGNGSISVLG